MEKKENEEVVQMCFLTVTERENEDHSNMQGQKWWAFSGGGPLHNGPSLEASPWQIFHCLWKKSYVQTGMPINIRIYSYRLFKGWVLHPIPESQEVKIKKSIKKVALSRSSQEQQESLTKEVGWLKCKKYVFAWSRRRSGSVKALGYLGNLKQLWQERRDVAAPQAGNAACLASAAKANNWFLSWWPARNLLYWYEKYALRPLLLLYSGAYTFQRAVLLGLSAEEAGRMICWLVKYQKVPLQRAWSPLREKLPGLIWITDCSTALLTHIRIDGSSGTKSEQIRNH